LTVQGAAEFLGVSVRWIQAALGSPPRERGSMPAYRLPIPGHCGVTRCT
jgi:hypothetical protein